MLVLAVNLAWSVFDDLPRTFQEEGTPAQFSKATSLSSLTFNDIIEEDDETKQKQENKVNKAKP